jgi:flagellar basal-body rod modification protein FlgD
MATGAAARANCGWKKWREGMIENVQPTSDPWSQTFGKVKPPDPDQGLTGKDTFLKLLVAQIRHQDPLSPTDGIQFVSQLAQFSGLEQTMQMRQELEAIHKLLDAHAGSETGKTGEDGNAGSGSDAAGKSE